MLKASTQKSVQITRKENKRNNCLSGLEPAWDPLDIDQWLLHLTFQKMQQAMLAFASPSNKRLDLSFQTSGRTGNPTHNGSQSRESNAR